MSLVNLTLGSHYIQNIPAELPLDTAAPGFPECSLDELNAEKALAVVEAALERMDTTDEGLRTTIVLILGDIAALGDGAAL